MNAIGSSALGITTPLDALQTEDVDLHHIL